MWNPIRQSNVPPNVYKNEKKKILGSHVKELVVPCGNEARLNAMVITGGRSARRNTNFPKPFSNLVSWDLNQDVRNEKPAIENHRTYYGSTHRWKYCSWLRWVES